MSAANLKNLPAATRSHTLEEARITAEGEAGSYLLSDGREARGAVSCVVRPAVGDRVLFTDAGDGCFILHILSREAGGVAALHVPGAAELRVEQARLSLLAHQRLALQSLAELELSALGTLSQSAADQFVRVAGSLVEQLNHHVSRSQVASLEAQSLLRLHGEQVLFTAAGDLKVDAERISMG